MRVLLAINGTDFGGTETVLVLVASELQNRGHHVEVLSLRPPGRCAGRLRRMQVPVDTLNMREKAGPIGALVALWRLTGWLRRRQFDLIHSFLPRANVMTRIANQLSGRRLPHVSREESTDHGRAKLVSRLNRWTARWTSVVLAVSPEVKQVLVDRDGLPASLIDILGNAIDLSAIDRQPPVDLRSELGLSREDFLFCAAGRLARVKGHAFLIRALRELHRQHPRAHLLLVGEGPEEARLRIEAKRCGLENYVHFLGFRRDLVRVLKSVDALVLPSLQEGVPLVLLEAMACAVPVIATAVGGVPGIIDHERTGILIAPLATWGTAGSTASRPAFTNRSTLLVEGLQWVIANEERRFELGRKAREYVAEHLCSERLVSRLEEIYSSLLRERMPLGADASAAPVRPRTALEAAAGPEPLPARRYRILFVITSSGRGGCENFLRDLTARIDRRRFEATVCSLRPLGSVGHEIARSGTDVLSLELPEVPGPFDLALGAIRLARLLDERQVDLVQSFLYRANFLSPIAKRLSRRRPVVLTSHRSLAPLQGRMAVLSSRLVHRLTDQVMANSEAVRDYLVSKEGARRDAVQVIYNGLEPGYFEGHDREALRSTLDFPADAPVVAAAGRLTPVKGMDLFLRGLASLGRPLTSVIVGDGPERGRLEAVAKELGLRPAPHFLGMREDLRALYSAFDVFVLSSLREGFPNVLVEAMVSGCAVVATRVGGVPEIVEHEKTGLVVEPGNPEALGQAIGRLVDDPELRRRLATAGRKTVEERFTLARAVAAHERIYTSLLRQ